MNQAKRKASGRLTGKPRVWGDAIPLQQSVDARRGRRPRKAFINVLVRTSTRSALHRLKASTGLPSQGEVIDYLVARLAQVRASE